MNKDYEDFESELDELEQELDDFESDFEDFDEDAPEFGEAYEYDEPHIESFEFTDVNTRTAILLKNDMIALLCLKTADQGGAICRVDPRETNPAVQLYDDPEKALDWFTKSIHTSRKNGWQVVYDGLPLQG